MEPLRKRECLHQIKEPEQIKASLGNFDPTPEEIRRVERGWCAALGITTGSKP